MGAEHDMRSFVARLLKCADDAAGDAVRAKPGAFVYGYRRGNAAAYRLAALWLLEDIGDHEQAAALAYWMGVTRDREAA